MSTYVIGVGTVGAGLWMSYNSGEKWRHIQRGPGIESSVRAVAESPHGGLFAVSDEKGPDSAGLWRSDDRGGNWVELCAGGGLEGELWSLGFDPLDDQRIYVGARPGILRSTDGGASFERLDTSISPACPIGVPRTTNIIVDPTDSDTVWASVEIGGLHRSRDGGDSWEYLGALGETEFHDDVHGFALRHTNGADPEIELLVTSPYGLARSSDEGTTWSWYDFGAFPGAKWPHAYARCVAAPQGSWNETIVACVGDYIPGQYGALEVSRDAGESWTRHDLDGTPRSTMYWLASHDDLEGVMVATSLFGQIYVTEDGAETWRKLDREFGEVRAVAVTPAD